MNDITDDDLIRMYRDGDADAFDVLFQRYHTSVYNFARSILGDFGGAEEIMQDTFMAIAKTARNYQPQGRFKSWLMRIVRNRSLNRLESERRRRTAFVQSGLEFVDPVDDDPTPADNAAHHDQTALLRRLMKKLPDRQREALSLHAFEQMGYRDIAEILEVPLNTVKTLIYQARGRLANELRGAAS